LVGASRAKRCRSTASGFGTPPTASTKTPMVRAQVTGLTSCGPGGIRKGAFVKKRSAGSLEIDPTALSKQATDQAKGTIGSKAKALLCPNAQARTGRNSSLTSRYTPLAKDKACTQAGPRQCRPKYLALAKASVATDEAKIRKPIEAAVDNSQTQF